MANDPGAFLLREGLISEDEALFARESAEKLGGTLPEHLVLAKAIADEKLTSVISHALRLPQIDPDELARIPTNVIAVIPADMAIELRTIPVTLTHGELTVAMSDPSDRHALDELAFFTDLPILRTVATQRQIAWCLAHYYGFVTELGQTLLSADGAAPADAAAADAAASRPERRMPLSDTHQAQAEPVISQGTQALLSGLAGDSWAATPGERGDTTAPAGPGRRARKLAPRDEPAPELSPRAGEVAVKSEREATPQSAELSLPAVLLDPALTGEAEAPDEQAVVLLDAPKRRAARATEQGVGAPGESGEHPAAAPYENGERASAAPAQPVAREATEPYPEIVAAAPLEPGHLDIEADGDDAQREQTDPYRPAGKKRPAEDDPEDTRQTLRLPRGKLAPLPPPSDLDDGWGPPGTTIPPPFLGAIPDSYEDPGSGAIPLPALGQEPRRRPTPAPAAAEVSPDDRETDAMLDAIAALEEAQTRDGIIATLSDYLAAHCGSAVFCTARSGGLRPFRQGERKGAPHIPAPGSPLGAVIAERKPFCGKLSTDDDRRFVTALLGDVEEVVAAAIAVRGRVVGVLLGPAPAKASFLERLAVIARAGGRALERILRARKAQ